MAVRRMRAVRASGVRPKRTANRARRGNAAAQRAARAELRLRSVHRAEVRRMHAGGTTGNPAIRVRRRRRRRRVALEAQRGAHPGRYRSAQRRPDRVQASRSQRQMPAQSHAARSLQSRTTRYGSVRVAPWACARCYPGYFAGPALKADIGRASQGVQAVGARSDSCRRPSRARKGDTRRLRARRFDSARPRAPRPCRRRLHNRPLALRGVWRHAPTRDVDRQDAARFIAPIRTAARRLAGCMPGRHADRGSAPSHRASSRRCAP